MFKNVTSKREKLDSILTRLSQPDCVLYAGLVPFVCLNFASAGTKGVLTAILNIVGDIFVVIGVFLLCVGLGNLIKALKTEDSNAQVNAVQSIAVAAVLIGVKLLMNKILKQTGSGVTVETKTTLNLINYYRYMLPF